MGRIKDSKVCVFCTKLSAEFNNSTFEKFYTHFLTANLTVDSNNSSGSSKKRKSNNSKKCELVNVQDKLTICGKCLPECELALQAKENVDKVESQVRKMQLELLKELDKLFGEIKGMNRHLKNIQQNMITAKDTAENSKKSDDKSSLQKQKENDKLIGIFQEELLKAFEDTQLFQKEISRKILKNPKSTLQIGQTDAANESTTNCDTIVVKTESSELSVDQIEDYYHLDKFSNFDGDIGSSHDYHFNDDCEVTVNDNPSIKNEARTNPVEDNVQETLSLSSSDSEADHKSSSSDLDFDPDNESPPSTSKSLKGMSKFRRDFISRIRKRRTIATSNLLPKSTSDPRRPFRIKYIQTSDKFLLEDYEILLLDSPEIFQCASCPFQVKIFPKKSTNHPEDLMFEHILSKHLLLYTCATCCKSFDTLYTLKYHKNSHLDPDQRPMVPCPICEKPISASSSNNMKGHQWTHLNFEEKRDPKNAHLMPTKIRQYFVEGRKNVCGSCGKDFINRSHLLSHEKTHLSLKDRKDDQVICTMCGKGILRSSFRVHEKWCGVERESKKSVGCPVCELKVKNKKWLDIHAGECHPGEKIFRCEVCGKMFASLAYLHNHMESHDQIKKYICEGCGLGYQQKRNLKRHKSGCKGIFKREIK